MKKVLCFGEALIDFLNFNNNEIEGEVLPEYRQFPGGAPANAAVAIAKLGGHARFVGQLGADNFGDFILNSLEKYGVDCRYVLRHNAAPTAMAFVHLDDQGERSFSFYRDNTADMLLMPEQIDRKWFDEQAIFHFCSNTLTEQRCFNTTKYMLAEASLRNMTISFDVNLRANLWPNKQIDIDAVNSLVTLSHIVKFSKEEFELLSKGQGDDYIAFCLNQSCQLLVITDGAQPIRYYTRDYHGKLTPPNTNVMDTTAAGDAFIGALLYAFSFANSTAQIIKQPKLLNAIMYYAAFAGAIAVSSAGAFPSLATQPLLQAKMRELYNLDPYSVALLAGYFDCEFF